MNDVCERGILFQPDMVRGLLYRGKRVTRRLKGLEKINERPDAWRYDGVNTIGDHIFVDCDALAVGVEPPEATLVLRCPYGVPGDRLWVREKWASPEADKTRQGRVAYDADGVCGCWCGSGEDRGFVYHGRVLEASGYRYRECFPASGSTTFGLGKYTDVRSGEYPSYRYGWRSSMFMPRWASRITLEISSVRPERVQDITEDDARLEGFTETRCAELGGVWTAKLNFLYAFLSINKRKRQITENPWAWRVEFRVLEPRSEAR